MSRSRALAPVVAFVVLAVVVAVLPSFVSAFRAQQFAYVAIYLVALLGLNVLTGYTGQISLGHGAFMAIGGYTTAILMADHGVKDVWTIPIAGRRRRRRRVPVRHPGAPALGPLPRARDVRDRGVDAGGDQALRGVHRRRERASTCSAMPELTASLDAGHRPRPRAHLQRLALLPLLDDRARRLRRRLAPRCAGGPGARSAPCATARPRRSRPASASPRYKTLAFGVSAAYAGVAGSLFAIATTFVNPDTFPIALSILLLVGVVVGGLGSLVGLIAGAVFIQFLPIWSQEVSKSPGAPAVVSGVVLIALMFVLPMGFAGLVDRLRALTKR